MQSNGSTSASAAAGRVVWMLLGPMGLLLASFAVLRTGDGWFTLADLIYWLVAAVMIVGRLLEFRGGDPRTADGSPASATDLRQYLLLAPAAALALWVVANVVANHWLPS